MSILKLRMKFQWLLLGAYERTQLPGRNKIAGVIGVKNAARKQCEEYPTKRGSYAEPLWCNAKLR